VARLLRAIVLGTITRIPFTRRELGGFLSGIGISYKHTRGEHPMVGKRMPDGTWDGERLYERLRAGKFVMVENQPGLPAAVLVRPDGYVAWASDRTPSAADLATARERWPVTT
jgi:hypothetical protein